MVWGTTIALYLKIYTRRTGFTRRKFVFFRRNRLFFPARSVKSGDRFRRTLRRAENRGAGDQHPNPRRRAFRRGFRGDSAVGFEVNRPAAPVDFAPDRRRLGHLI